MERAGQGGDSEQSAEALVEDRRYRLLAMKMTELRPICKKHGVPMHGTKEAIVERLLGLGQAW